MRRSSKPRRLALAALLSTCLGGASAGPGRAAEAEPPPLEQIAGDPSCLSAGEAELAALMNDYRKANGLSPLPVFKSLTLVAKWHAYDLEVNQAGKMADEHGQPCGLHSWSEKGGSRWTKVCYRSDPFGTHKMWGKPREVTGRRYKGNGYENLYFNSQGRLTPARVLELWAERADERDVLLQRGGWGAVPLSGLGVALSERYAVVWFGDAPDPQGAVRACGEAGP